MKFLKVITFLFGTETWTLSKDEKWIEYSEMRFMRMIENVHYQTAEEMLTLKQI